MFVTIRYVKVMRTVYILVKYENYFQGIRVNFIIRAGEGLFEY